MGLTGPETALLIGSIGSGLVGGITAPQGQKLSSFQGGPADPTTEFENTQKLLTSFLGDLSKRSSTPIASPVTPQAPASYSGGDLPMTIGVTAKPSPAPVLNPDDTWGPADGSGSGSPDALSQVLASLLPPPEPAPPSGNSSPTAPTNPGGDPSLGLPNPYGPGTIHNPTLASTPTSSSLADIGTARAKAAAQVLLKALNTNGAGNSNLSTLGVPSSLQPRRLSV